jgi:hypothetical protein
MTRPPPKRPRTASAVARKFYRACRLLGMSPASSRAEVAAAIAEGIRAAAAVRAGGRP